MPDPNSFENLVKNIRDNMSTVSDSASASLAQNSFTDPLQEAARKAKESRIAEEEDSTLERLASSLKVGAYRTAGFVLSAPYTGVAADLSNIPQDYLEAYIKVKEADEKGLEGPEIDAARKLMQERKLGEQAASNDPRQFFGQKLVDTQTYDERIEAALGASKKMREINKEWDISSEVDPSKKQALSKDIDEVYEVAVPKIKEGTEQLKEGNLWGGSVNLAEGATDLLFGGGKGLLDNPVAVGEYVAENIPQLATGLLGKIGKILLATSTTGYSGDIYTKALLDFQEQNEGRLPTEKEIDQMLGSSLLAGAADLVGDVSIINGLKAAKKSLLSPTGTTKGAATDTAKKSLLSPVTGTAKGVASEAPTEAFQTYQEQRAELKDPNLRDVYEAAVIGGAAGGTIRGAGEVAITAVSEAKNAATKADETVKTNAETKAKIDEAVNTGDFSGIDNPVAEAEAIIKRNAKEEVTEEEKQSNLERLNQLVNAEQTAQVENMEKLVTLYEKQSANPETFTDEEARQIKDLESAINDSDATLNNLRNLQAGATTGTIDVTLEDIKQAKEGNTESAQRVFGSYRIDPNTLNEQDARELAESPAFTSEQKAELKNHAEFQSLLKSASEVGQNIRVGNLGNVRKGDRPFLGIQNYRDIISNAVNSGDTQTAQQYLGMLGNFVEHQKTKANYLKQATDSIKSGQPVAQDVRNALADYGIKKLTPATVRLYENTIQPEADLLEQAYSILSEKVSMPTQGSAVSSVGTTTNENVQTETNTTGSEVATDTTVSESGDRNVVEQPVGEVQRGRIQPEETETESGDGQYSSKNRSVNKTSVELKSTVSDKVKKVEGFKVNLGYEGLTDIEVYKNDNGKWRIRNTSAEPVKEGIYPHYPETFNSSKDALDILNFNSKDELNNLALRLDPQRVKSKTATAVNLSFDALKSAIDIQAASRQVLNLLIDVKNNILSMEEASAKIKALKDKSVIDTNTYNTIKSELDAIDITPKKITSNIQQTYTPTEQQEGVSVTEQILSQPNDVNAPITEQNLVVRNFAKGQNVSALDTIQNFIGSAKANPNIVENYVDEQEVDNAKMALDNFLAFYDLVKPSLDIMHKPKVKGYEFQNYVEFLTVDGQLPENVKAAIAVGAYDWLTNNASQTVFNSDDDIRSMLGMGDDAVIPPQIRDLFKTGIPQSLMVESMGQAAAAALNIRPKKTAMMNQQNALENALGGYSFALIKQLGWLDKEVVVKKPQLDAVLGPKGHTIPETIRLMPLKTEGFRLAEPIRNSLDGSKVYPALMRKMFSTTQERPEPTFKPQKAPSKVKKSFMRVSERTREILNKVNAWKWSYNKSYDLFAALDRDSQRAVMGYDFEADNHIAAKAAAAHAKNEAIDREIDALNYFADIGYGKPFYLSWEVWKNQRMGINSVINPQTSKLHRHFIGLNNWITKVDPNNTAQYNKYLVTVAGGFGLLPDKKSEEWVLEQFKSEVLSNEVILGGIEAMRKLREEPEADFEQQQEWYSQIVAAVKEGGENAHTFQALETLAAEAIADGQPFEHSMFREVDGITNGVNITSIQFPDANEDMFALKMARQGMYSDATNGFADWKTKEQPDSYEGIATKWNEFIVANGIAETPLYKALAKYVGEIGRNTAKSPLMTTIYGAGTDGVIANAANIAIDELYTKLEDILKRNDSAALKELAKDLKVITGVEPKFNYMAESLFEANKDFELKPRELKKFVSSFDSTYREGLSAALETEYADLFEARNKFNAAINLAGAAFQEMYNQRVTELRQGLDLRMEDITVEQHEKIIADMASISPIIPTLMSGTDYRTGVNLMKTERIRTEESAYKVDISFNLPNVKTLKQEGRKLGFQSPGVGAIPIAVQSLDATNMVRAMNFSQPFLNVHDAQAVGDADAYSNPQLLNYAHYKNMAQYSIPKEFARMFDRVFAAAGPEVIENVMNNPKNARYLKTFKGMNIQDIGNDIRSLANNFNKVKNERLDKMAYVGQYYLGAQTGYNPKDLSKQSLENAVKEDVKDIRAKATNRPKTMGEQASTLGSSQNRSLKDQYTFETHLEVNRFNVQQVFDYLGNLGTKKDSDAHTAHLKSVLDNMVSKVLEPIDLHIAKSVGEETKGMITGTDMYIVNQDINLVSSAIPTRMRMSSQEVMTHELIHAITIAGLDKNIAARREIKRLYEIAAKITPEMLTNNSQNPHELKAAEELLDYLFNPRLTAGRSNHLHEFVAFSMTNEPFRALLADIKTKPAKADWFAGDNLLEKISSFFSNLLDWLNGKFFTGTYNLSADKQMDTLVRQIAQIEGNNRGLLVNAIDKGLAPLSMVGNRTNQFVRTAIARVVETNLVKNSRVAIVRVGGEVGRLLINNTYARFMGETLSKVSNNVLKAENAYVNEMRAIITEAKGRTRNNAALHDIKRIGNSAIDRMRQQLRNAVSKHLIEEFDPTRPLTKEEKSALSYAVIKSDLNVLVAEFGLQDALNLISDSAALDTKINQYIQGMDNFTKLQSENLGYFMATGYSRIDIPLLNAHNIARRFTTGESIPSNVQQIEEKVDVLASLYALKYLDNNHRANAVNVINHEMSRAEANGVTALIYTLDMVRKDAKEKLFKNTPELYIKGYMADHVDPNVAIKVGLASDEAFLNKQGYVKGPKLEKDLTDPLAKDRYLYVNSYGGMQAYLAGAVYLQSKKSKGTDITDLSINLNDVPVNSDISVVDQITKSKLAKAKAQYAVGKLPPITGAKMVPVVNGKGEIVSHRYIMGDVTKDTLMRRDTSFEVVMGIMASESSVKPEIEAQNNRVVKALYDQFVADYSNEPSAYVTIERSSSNQRYSEIWNMLPYEMKQEIREVWGKERLVVRREHVDLLFGYRKHSITNKWQKDPALRNAWDKALISSAELFFGSKAVPRLRAAEDLIQELVRMGKDVIVIKSFVVTLANTFSNLFLLGVKGINPIVAMKDYTIAYKAAQDYKRKSAKIANYRLKLEDPNVSLGNRNFFESEIAKLTEDLAASPVADLINQGVLQNIVEDVDIGTDTFTFKRGLIDKATEKFGLDKKTKNVPQWMKSLAGNVLVLQGSGLYNNLRDMAQLSDFGARYALYNHLTKKGMSKEDAIGSAMDTFIDYDLPTGVGMQYANDMGIVLFSKYLIRVQKIILQTFRDNPAAVLSVIAMQNYFNFGTNIHESLMGVTNPLDRLATPLDMVAALDDSVILNTVSNTM